MRDPSSRTTSPPRFSPVPLTDLYELTMLQAYYRGAHDGGRRLQPVRPTLAPATELSVDLRVGGQVSYPGSLVLESDRGQMATRCTRCESAFTTIYATCPVCQGTCEKVNLWQEILLFAARHNIAAHVVDTHPALTQHGGVTAVLSRAKPWEPATAAAKASTVL